MIVDCCFGTNNLKDVKLMADAETGEFWGFFGGFAPLPKKALSDEDKTFDSHATKLLCVEKGKAKPIEADSLRRKLLDTNKCCVLDCGWKCFFFLWMGRNTSLDDRKSASGATETQRNTLLERHSGSIVWRRKELRQFHWQVAARWLSH